MSNVARGVQEVRITTGTIWTTEKWVWQAFLQNGSGAVFCNHDHKSAKAALNCTRKMAKAGGHPIHVAEPRRRRASSSQEHGEGDA